jgi:transcriptional repressor of cell division inhibition gene dicB
MTYNQALSRFGTQVKLASALGITQPTVSAWGSVIPAQYQYQLEIITDGALRADAELRQPRQAA